MLFDSAMRQGPSSSVCEKPTRIFLPACPPEPPAPPPAGPPSCLRHPASPSASRPSVSRSESAARLTCLSDLIFQSPLAVSVNHPDRQFIGGLDSKPVE